MMKMPKIRLKGETTTMVVSEETVTVWVVVVVQQQVVMVEMMAEKRMMSSKLLYQELSGLRGAILQTMEMMSKMVQEMLSPQLEVAQKTKK